MIKKIVILILIVVFSISMTGCFVTVGENNRSLRGYSNCPTNNPYFFFEQNTKRRAHFKPLR